ncbi:MAG: DUF2238 domain-containing protein [Pseudomonadales bacterium]|nr:DUF2238 domain-containing protein [Pseudomonadales bacterium]
MITVPERWLLLVSLLLALVVSLIHPYDGFTWFLETFPVLLGLPLLLITFRRFPLTPLCYRLLFIHALILIVGAHYTYARVPLGFWMQDWFDFPRNHYDRIGHIAQGFIPAILAREILLRRSPLEPGKWLFYIVTSICLAFSAFYEMLEWWTAIAAEEASVDFLGTQGDGWDTQWDMFLALLGALASQLIFAHPHNRAIKQLQQIAQ